jgi:predicted nucleic acid-binding protein
MATQAKPLDVCVDACVLINLAIVGRIDLLGRIQDMVFHVPQEVANEITLAEQKQQVERGVASGALRMARMETVEELEAFAEYSRCFGKGESACLTIATCRGWIISTDETKDKRLTGEISAKGIPLINTPGILAKAIRQRVLTVEEADAIKAELEKNRFRMNFNSFRDLVE